MATRQEIETLVVTSAALVRYLTAWSHEGEAIGENAELQAVWLDVREALRPFGR